MTSPKEAFYALSRAYPTTNGHQISTSTTDTHDISAMVVMGRLRPRSITTMNTTMNQL